MQIALVHMTVRTACARQQIEVVTTLLQVAAMLSQAGPARKVSSGQANGAEVVPEADSVFEGEVLYVSGAPLPSVLNH